MSKWKILIFFQSAVQVGQTVGTPANGRLQRLVVKSHGFLAATSHIQATAVDTFAAGHRANMGVANFSLIVKLIVTYYYT